MLDSPSAYWEVADSVLAHLEEEPTWVVVASPAQLSHDLEVAYADATPAHVQKVINHVEEMMEHSLAPAAREQLLQSLHAALATSARSVARWGDRASALALGARIAEGGFHLPFASLEAGALPPHRGALVPQADLVEPGPGNGEAATVELAVQLGSPEVHFWKRHGGLRGADGLAVLERVNARQLLVARFADGPLHRHVVEASMRHGVELVLENPRTDRLATRVMPGTRFILRAGLVGAAAAA